MTILTALILFITAVVGGALNSVAGCGSFITFPSLIFTGVLPIQANATCTLALLPGSLARQHKPGRWCSWRYLTASYLSINPPTDATFPPVTGNTLACFKPPHHL